MKIGITGSAGFLGANLVRYIRDRFPHDHELVCFYSRRKNNPLTEGLDLTFRHLDVTSREEVLEKTADLDLLFHVAGVVDYSRTNARYSWDVNVLGTGNVFDAVLENGIGRLVYVSSINVLGTTERRAEPADETNNSYASPANPICFRNRLEALEAVDSSQRGDYGFLSRSRVPYFDSKLAGYELALERHRSRGVPVTIVLPGTAVGGGDIGISITRLVYLSSQGKLRITLPGATSFVAAGDVAAGIWLASERGQAGRAYIISGRAADNLLYTEFMGLVARVARTRYGRNVPERFLAFPKMLCLPLAGVLRWLPAELELTPALVHSGAVTHRFSITRAREELGYDPKISLDQAIAACIDFYTTHTKGKL